MAVVADGCTIAEEVADWALASEAPTNCTARMADVALAAEALAGLSALCAGMVDGERKGTVGGGEVRWRVVRMYPRRADRAWAIRRTLPVPPMSCASSWVSLAVESSSDVGLTDVGLTTPRLSIGEKAARAALKQRVDSVLLR